MSTRPSATQHEVDWFLERCQAVLYRRGAGDTFPIQYASAGLAWVLGYQVDECLRDRRFWIDRVHPQDRPRVVEELRNLSSGSLFIHSYRFRANDGLYVRVRDQVCLRREGSDGPRILGCLTLEREELDGGAALRERQPRSVQGSKPRTQPPESGRRVRDRIAWELACALQGGEVRASALARKLRVGPRQLQRYLAKEGTSFQRLLETARANLAGHYLNDERLPIAEVGALLGYSEPSSFHRAFKRWTGMTPAEFRAARASDERTVRARTAR